MRATSSGKITNLTRPDTSVPSPLLKGFVQSVQPAARTVTIKIRSRIEGISVRVPEGKDVPAAYSTILFLPVIENGKILVKEIAETLHRPPVGTPVKEVLSPTDASNI